LYREITGSAKVRAVTSGARPEAAIGRFTPPMAVNLMVTCKIARIAMESTVPWVIWMVAAMCAALLAVLLVPGLAPWLPRALGYG
jgi:TRAP-type C4-dicarboxylate transport system permease large subunit